MDTLTLASLAALLAKRGWLAGTRNLDDTTGATPLTGADCDSRVVRPGHLFICKGVAFRSAYLVSALEKGAVAYLCDTDRAAELAAAAPEVPALIAHPESLRPAMALAAAEAFGRPDRALRTVGITGTKGKSTVSYMLRAVLDEGAPAPRTAVMGSIGTFDGVEDLESPRPRRPTCGATWPTRAKRALPTWTWRCPARASSTTAWRGSGSTSACS